MRLHRSACAQADPDAGRRLAAAFDPAWLGPDARSVAGYCAVRDEIDPQDLLRRLAAAGYLTALPATPPRGTYQTLEFRSWRPGDPLIRGAFGVGEPSVSAGSVRPDVLLVPLLAFDRQGGRLGYGAGYYDRTIADLRASGRVRTLGLAFAAQEVAVTPRENHDVLLDGVVTETGLLEVMAAGSGRATQDASATSSKDPAGAL
jgi:5-formyltetrahydrofolate cyclo-ligase